MLFTLGNSEYEPDIALKISLSKLFIPELFSQEENLLSIQKSILEDTDNLFIAVQTAVTNKQGLLLIGNTSLNVFVTPKTLIAIVSDWVSANFRGNIYLYSAISEPCSKELADYVNTLSQLLSEDYKCQVFYSGGTESDRIPPIGADAWIMAN